MRIPILHLIFFISACGWLEAAQSLGELIAEDRIEIARAARQGDMSAAKTRLESATARRGMWKSEILRRLDVLTDVATFLHAGDKRGLEEVVAEMRATVERSPRTSKAPALARVGEVQERLLGDVDAAVESYWQALQEDPNEPTAKSGLERIYLSEKMAAERGREHALLRGESRESSK